MIMFFVYTCLVFLENYELNAQLINPIKNALVSVLTMMAQVDPVVGKPKDKLDNLAPGVVTGIIDLEGEQARGSIAVSFSKAVALDITNRMLRMELTEIDDQVKDMVGEMANMVAGGAKREMEEDGYNFKLTLPTVLSGERHEINHRVHGPKIVLPFKVASGKFYIEICFKNDC